MAETSGFDADKFWSDHDAEMRAKYGEDWHCDDWHEKRLGPPCVAAYLEWARARAHGAFEKNKPALYADHPEMGRVRVVMASRFGDVGITAKLTDARGYERRVMLGALTKFAAKP